MKSQFAEMSSLSVVLFVPILLSFFWLQSLSSDDKAEIEKSKLLDNSSTPNILCLTSDNFTDILNNSSVLLVTMFAGHSEKSQKFLSIFDQLNQFLNRKASQNNITMAKIDVIKSYDIYERYSLPGTPMLFLFKNGGDSYFEFHGNRSDMADIMSWVQRKLRPAAVELTSAKQATEFVASANMTVVAFFKTPNSERSRMFISVVEHIDDAEFAITNNGEVLQAFDVTEDTVVMFNKYDGENVTFSVENTWTEYNLGVFILNHIGSAVQEFSWSLMTNFISPTIQLHAFLFTQTNSTYHRGGLLNFTTVAREYRGKVTFLSVDVQSSEATGILPTFHIAANNTPALRAARIQAATDPVRYSLSTFDGGNLSVAVIRSFIQGILDGRVDPISPSEEIPDDWNKSAVKTVVGKNFHDVVKDPRKHVIISFTASWCLKCELISDHLKQLAVDYKETTDLLFATTDFSRNEYKDVERHQFPAVKLFLKESNEEIDFTGLATYEDLKQFIDYNLISKQQQNKDKARTKEEL